MGLKKFFILAVAGVFVRFAVFYKDSSILANYGGGSIEIAGFQAFEEAEFFEKKGRICATQVIDRRKSSIVSKW